MDKYFARPDAVQKPSWECWLAQVKLARFCMRHVYTVEDGAQIDRLYEEFLSAFQAVKIWQDKGYEKPKFHPPAHLRAALEEFGPFRNFWCMPWEAFLQVLKRMFKACNWKSAPWTVCQHWAVKSVMHYRDPSRCAWYEDEVTATSEYIHDLDSLASHSILVRSLLSLRGPRP